MAVMPKRYRFTVDEYDRMAQVGLLTECDRVELLDGDIVEMSPIGDRHASVVARVSAVLWQRLGGRGIVWASSCCGRATISMRAVAPPSPMSFC